MSHWKLFVAVVAVVICGIFSGSSSAAPITLSSTTIQSGTSDHGNAIFQLTGASPYNFAGQNYGGLGSINSLSVTLKITDGDTAPGDFDHGNLTLGLDGIDTGIKLDGFPEDSGQTDPNAAVQLTITGNPQNAAAILAALQADGQLVGTIIDHTPGDNGISIPFKPTTLSLTGGEVPEPTTLMVLGLGVVGLVGYQWRRRRMA